jgi:hypothetical protein
MAGSGISSSFEFKPGSLRANMKRFDGDVNALVAGVVDYQGTRAMSWMKVNAKWKDRTGNARQTLAVYGLHSDKWHELHLHGGVPYQIWLEVRWSGKYAIIGPAVKYHGLALMNRLRGIVTKLGKGV